MRTNRIFGLITLAVAALAAAAWQPAARAQVSAVPVISNGVLTNAATWSPATAVTIDGQSMVGLSIRFTGDGSDTANIITTIFRSADGVNFETSPPASCKFTNALNNTTAVIGYHQIPRDIVGSVRAVKISVQNAAVTVKGTAATVAIVKKKEPPL